MIGQILIIYAGAKADAVGENHNRNEKHKQEANIRRIKAKNGMGVMRQGGCRELGLDQTLCCGAASAASRLCARQELW